MPTPSMYPAARLLSLRCCRSQREMVTGGARWTRFARLGRIHNNPRTFLFYPRLRTLLRTDACRARCCTELTYVERDDLTGIVLFLPARRERTSTPRISEACNAPPWIPAETSFTCSSGRQNIGCGKQENPKHRSNLCQQDAGNIS